MGNNTWPNEMWPYSSLTDPVSDPPMSFLDPRQLHQGFANFPGLQPYSGSINDSPSQMNVSDEVYSSLQSSSNHDSIGLSGSHLRPPPIPSHADHLLTPTSMLSREHSLARTEDSTSTNHDESASELPYSQLIYKCLKAAPGHELPLRHIYAWFSENTDKGARGSDQKKWQNSVRHNLSLNDAFVKGTRENPGKKAPKNEWHLITEAVEDGVLPTTRYRRKCPKVGGSRKARARNARARNALAGDGLGASQRLLRSAARQSYQPRDSAPPSTPSREVGLSLPSTDTGAPSRSTSAAPGHEATPYPTPEPAIFDAASDEHAFTFADGSGVMPQFDWSSHAMHNTLPSALCTPNGGSTPYFDAPMPQARLEMGLLDTFNPNLWPDIHRVFPANPSLTNEMAGMHFSASGSRLFETNSDDGQSLPDTSGTTDLGSSTMHHDGSYFFG